MHRFFFFMALSLLPLTAFGQTVFFKADGESGTVKPPWDGVYYTSTVSNSTSVKKNGTRSFKFTNAGGENDAKVIVYGSGRARHKEAYYSAWYYIHAGYQHDRWTNIMQWKTDNTNEPLHGTVKTIIEARNINGVRQAQIGMKLCKAEPCTFNQAKPKPIPFQKWFHLEVYMKVAPYPNGVMTVWQDGEQIFHITGINTLTTISKSDPDKESTNDYLYWGIGSYIDPVAATSYGEQTVFADDAMITNYRVFSTSQNTALSSPTNLRVVMD